MMPEADEELYFVIDEKQNQVELTENGQCDHADGEHGGRPLLHHA